MRIQGRQVRRLVTTFPLAVVLAMGTGSASADGEAPTANDLVSLKRPSEPALSPDGRTVAYTVQETDWDANAFRTQIWLVDVASATSRQVTRGAGSSSAAAWSPDGHTIAFLSDRDGTQQVWLINA